MGLYVVVEVGSPSKVIAFASRNMTLMGVVIMDFNVALAVVPPWKALVSNRAPIELARMFRCEAPLAD